MQRKELLENIVFRLNQSKPFYGSILQEINIRYDSTVPVAAIYLTREQKYVIIINYDTFLTLNEKEQVAVLFHEVLHFTHGHIARSNSSDKCSKLANIAADLAINQFIPDLPNECVNIKKFKKQDGSDFPEFETFETYLELLKASTSPKYGGQQEEGINDEMLSQFEPLDTHSWEELDESEKQKALEEAKKIIQRTIDKTAFGHDKIPIEVRDYLKDIDAHLNNINYKAILKTAIKKTLTACDRKYTWNKPSKRYGVYSQGTKNADIPSLGIYIDTSGSISYTEINAFLQFLTGLLKVGSKKCELGFWHTNLYKVQKFKLNMQIVKDDIQSGGTDPNPTLEHILRKNNNLNLILTDGFFGGDFTKVKQLQNIIWVISKGGNLNHPYSFIGKTISL